MAFNYGKSFPETFMKVNRDLAIGYLAIKVLSQGDVP
jgi:hypothetical protein